MKNFGPALLSALQKIQPWTSVLEAARARRDVWLVGGLLRDRAAGKKLGPALDIDLAVKGGSEALARELARRLQGTAFPLHEETGIFRVSPKSGSPALWQIDVAEIQGKDILEDLARRDFTVNALALPLTGRPELLDPYGALRDIRVGRLRALSPSVFREDPIRLLRAYRLASQFDWTPDAKTAAAIAAERARIRSTAGEKVRSELLKILASERSAFWLRAMDKTGLLTALFPELEASRRCARAYYGAGGVLKHSLAAVERMDFLLANLKKIYPKLGAAAARQVKEGYAGNHAALLRLAVLLHDVSKPECAKTIKGRLRFFGHEARGAEVSRAMLERMRFSQEETALVAAAVHHHLRPGNLAAGGIISDKAVFRFFRDLGPHGTSLLLLCWADHSSYLKPPALRQVLPAISRDPHDFDARARKSAGAKAKTLYHLQVVSYLLKKLFRQPRLLRPPKLIDGSVVMKVMKIPPGPKVGEALRLLQEAQAEGKVKNRLQALAFLKNLPL